MQYKSHIFESIAVIACGVCLLPCLVTPAPVKRPGLAAAHVQTAPRMQEVAQAVETTSIDQGAAVVPAAPHDEPHSEASSPAPLPPPAPAPAPVDDTCAGWMQAAGITDTTNAARLLNWESHCNPYAVNPTSGACGLAQELPCGKSGCNLGDGACEMKWFAGYVIGRYGSMAAAVSFHLAMGWY